MVQTVIVAIDYDATWSADPELWEAFSQYARRRGHIVALITNRPDNPTNRSEISLAVSGHVDHMILAGPMPKREAAAQFGLRPNIWIDDNPVTVTEGLRL
jgi:FMN phosphatase YigB (HAD superfamily)